VQVFENEIRELKNMKTSPTPSSDLTEQEFKEINIGFQANPMNLEENIKLAREVRKKL
jgi:hypothetical protein